MNWINAIVEFYSPLATFLYYFTNLSLFGEKITIHHVLENKQNSRKHPLYWGNPAMINQNYFFTYLLLQIKPVIIKTFNFKFENVSFIKLPKKENYWQDMLLYVIMLSSNWNEENVTIFQVIIKEEHENFQNSTNF